MAPRDDHRTAYLAGEDAAALPPAERAELDEIRELLHSPAMWAQPDPGLEDRVVDAIAGEAAADPATPRNRATPPNPAMPRATAMPGEAAMPGGAAMPGEAAGAARGERRRRSLRARLWPTPHPLIGFAGAAAAAVAIAIALSVSGGSRPPQRFAMVVSGTALAANAHGSATLTKTASGWRIELSASGLPHLANGRYYEAWLKNAAGVLVPVGTFNDARRVTLWAGVPVPSFPTLTVTSQRVGAGPASSGQRVLSGTIGRKP